MKLLLASALAVAQCAASTPASWHVQKGNACTDGLQCGCQGDDCKDVPGKLHYAGKLANASACEATCAAAGAEDCSVWLYSSTSSHCFWRLDGIWNVDDSEDWVTSGCIEVGAGGNTSQCVPGCGSCSTQLAPAPAPSSRDNMNGLYPLSGTPGSDVTKFPVEYKDRPADTKFFEVYSPPITSLYSQVFWTRTPTVDLPAHIVNKFKGKTMAVVGFEMDQVRQTPQGDVKVPINVAYNHHFESTMIGNGAQFQRIEVTDENDPRLPAKGMGGHRRPNMSEAWIVVPDKERELAANGVPSSVGFGAANGGEYRKSYHGYAPGYAQLIHSPEQFSITPMQIDTFNRDKMSLTGGPFVPGPVPRTSLAPLSGPDAVYSGLLECPVTTRLRKDLSGGSYEMVVDGNCNSGQISNAEECFAAADKVHFPAGANITYSTTVQPGAPSGCIASVDFPSQDSNASVQVIFNTGPTNATASCGAASGQPADLVSFGRTKSLVDVGVSIDTPQNNVTITLTGPADVWFGVGFNATQMKDAPYAIIVEAPDGAAAKSKVSERQLADQSPGTQLDASVTVLSDTTDASSNTRTVVLSRGLKGATSSHYSFNAVNDVSLNFINALGAAGTLAYHKTKTASSIAILPVGADGDSVCVCPVKPPPFGEGTGTLTYTDGTSVGCCNHCMPEPRTDMLEQKNPTCDLRTYVGGQLSCHHMWSLLDADQDIPWPDQPLNYSLKFRFWYQEYNETGGSVEAKDTLKPELVDISAPSHQDVKRTTWGIASPVEYDVPKCDNNTIGCECDATGNCIHRIQGQFAPPNDKIKLVAAHFHCHAPTCLSVALYNNKTGELICEEKPIYGGHGAFEPGFDEDGYITQPPCLWGDAKYGLTPPPSMKGITLHAVKTSNATYGHHGEMAWMQMFYVDDV